MLLAAQERPPAQERLGRAHEEVAAGHERGGEVLEPINLEVVVGAVEKCCRPPEEGADPS